VYLYQEYENISSILLRSKRIAIIDSVSQDLYFGSSTPAAKDGLFPIRNFDAAKKTPVYVVLFSEKYNLNQLFHH
jgi:hypothetical protein